MNLRLGMRRYQLPLRRPWRSAHGELRERCGWLVSASAEGMRGFGDCAPLPEAGTESDRQARRRLQHWCTFASTQTGEHAIQTLLDALARAKQRLTPAADCAVESALLDLLARHRGLPLRCLLAARAADRLAVNAALGSAAELTAEQIATAAADGYRVFKIKLGNAPLSSELAGITAAASALPRAGLLRLDANGAWTPDVALHCIAALDGIAIDCLEEPLREPVDADLAALQAAAKFSIALDESLPRRLRPLDLTRLPVRRLVLKPGVLGGLRPTLELARRATAAGHEVVVTSLVESAAGLWANVQLAAAIHSPLAHGLATSAWLADDLGPAPIPRAGQIALPPQPGSGFAPAGRTP